MSELEGGGAFPHILPPTIYTGSKIDNIRGFTIHFLSDGVCFLGVGALKFSPFLQNWAWNPALATFRTPWVIISIFFLLACTLLLPQNSFYVFGLFVANLYSVSKTFSFFIFNQAFFRLSQPAVQGGISWVVCKDQSHFVIFYFFLPVLKYKFLSLFLLCLKKFWINWIN